MEGCNKTEITRPQPNKDLFEWIIAFRVLLWIYPLISSQLSDNLYSKIHAMSIFKK